MPNLPSSIMLGTSHAAETNLKPGKALLSGDLSTVSEGSSELPGFAMLFSHSLEQMPAALAQWVADGDATLQGLPLKLPATGNELPLQQGGQPLAAVDESSMAASLQQWLAVLPLGAAAADAALPDGELPLTQLSMNAAGDKSRPMPWLRGGEWAVSLTGQTATTATGGAAAADPLAALGMEGGERSQVPVRSPMMEQALSQALFGAGEGKSTGQRVQPLIDSVATPIPVTAHPAPVATPAPVMTGIAGASQTLSIDTPPGQAGWSEAVGEKVNWLVQNNQSSAQVRLNPPHLGPMEIKVAMTNDQANVTFTVHHQLTADQLESALPRLREMLADSGLQLANLDVRHQGQNGEGGSAEGEAADLSAEAELDPGAGGADSASRGELSLHSGVLDTYA